MIFRMKSDKVTTQDFSRKIHSVYSLIANQPEISLIVTVFVSMIFGLRSDLLELQNIYSESDKTH